MIPKVVSDEVYRLPRDGRDGARGRDGAQGEQGPPGPSGANGNDGKSLTPAGYWNARETFWPGEVVSYNDSSYVARKESQGVRPGLVTNEDWQLLAAKGERGPEGERGGRGPRGRSGSDTTGGLANVAFGTMPSSAAPCYVDGSGLAHPAYATTEPTSIVAGFREGTQLRVSGIVTQKDWSVVAGTPLLEAGSTYYLGNSPGTISTESGSPYSVVVGSAISPWALVINSQRLVQLRAE